MEKIDTSLKALSSRVMNILREVSVSTYSDMTQRIIMEYGRPPNDVTLKRRVYDVLNVFFAIGVIEKDDKIIRVVANPNFSRFSKNEFDNNNYSKRHLITQQKLKLRLLFGDFLRIMWLEKENSIKYRPTDKIMIPFFILQTNNEIIKDRETYTTLAKSTIIISPQDILRKLYDNIDTDFIRGYSPQIDRIISCLQDTGDSDSEDM